jgi:SulP family sulfate permease
VLAGILFSLAFFVIRSSLPRVYPVVPDPTYRHLVRRPGAPVCPQLGIMNIRGPLFFGAVYHIEEELRHNLEENPGQNILVLRMHGVDICDLSGIEMLESTVKTYRSFGGEVFLVRPRQPVLEKMEQSGFLDETLGRDHLLHQEDAIEHLFDRVIDPIVCVFACQHRIFAECKALEKHPSSEHLPIHPYRVVEEGRFLEPTTFAGMVETGDSILIDVREAEEFDRGHLAGSQLVPLRELVEIPERVPRDRSVLIVCRSGRRTARAMQILRDQEFDNYLGLRGGILAWRAAGLPLVVE